MTKLERMIQKGTREGVACLRSICANESGGEKAADRISAAKALIDYGLRGEGKGDTAVKVIIDNVPREYLA